MKFKYNRYGQALQEAIQEMNNFVKQNPNLLSLSREELKVPVLSNTALSNINEIEECIIDVKAPSPLASRKNSSKVVPPSSAAIPEKFTDVNDSIVHDLIQSNDKAAFADANQMPCNRSRSSQRPEQTSFESEFQESDTDFERYNKSRDVLNEELRISSDSIYFGSTAKQRADKNVVKFPSEKNSKDLEYETTLKVEPAKVPKAFVDSENASFLAQASPLIPKGTNKTTVSRSDFIKKESIPSSNQHHRSIETSKKSLFSTKAQNLSNLSEKPTTKKTGIKAENEPGDTADPLPAMSNMLDSCFSSNPQNTSRNVQDANRLLTPKLKLAPIDLNADPMSSLVALNRCTDPAK